MQNLGLYIHIPFCTSKCRYCDFCSYVQRDEKTVTDYVARLCREIADFSPKAGAYTVDTVYFGGGTPTFLAPEYLEKILNAIKANYNVNDDAEITTECNPATESADWLKRLRAMGFNRLSVGVQSGNDEELKALGRPHDFDLAVKTVNDAVSVGFDNVSVDVMFGIPEQTRATLKNTLDKLTALPITHLSLYNLQIEEGTVFYRKKDTLNLPDEEETRAMYFDAVKQLKNAGFEQYEISNFARDGHVSRHNLKYWHAEPFVGFGASAFSDFEGVRFGNGRGLKDYMENKEIDAVSPADRESEYVMLGIRLCEGISRAAFSSRFGHDLTLPNLDAYVKRGLVTDDGDRIRFTLDGFYVSNYVLSDWLDFD